MQPGVSLSRLAVSAPKTTGGYAARTAVSSDVGLRSFTVSSLIAGSRPLRRLRPLGRFAGAGGDCPASPRAPYRKGRSDVGGR
jgi:hypothetical protein